MATRIIYTPQQLRGFNNFSLRQIPSRSNFDVLNCFLSQGTSSNLSQMVNKLTIPQYLIDKYGESFKMPDVHQHQTRRQLCPTVHDHNDKSEMVRELLSKLSRGNKTKILDQLNQLGLNQITAEESSVIINHLYSYAVDLSDFVDLYVEIILVLKEVNYQVYQSLIKKIIATAYCPIIFDKCLDNTIKNRQWRMGNLSLIAELYRHQVPEINITIILEISQHLLQPNVTPTTENLESCCELLKKIMATGVVPDALLQLIDTLEPLIDNKNYEQRQRYLVQSVLEKSDEYRTTEI
jgi:hypothetical protein